MRLVVVVLCLCIAAVALGPVQPALAAERLDQENLVSTGIMEPLPVMPRNQFWAQTFTPGLTGELTTVTFGIGSSAAASVTIEIFELVIVDNVIPRTVLATATADVAAGDCDPNNLVSFTFNEPAEVVAERTYFFAVYTNENTTNVCHTSSDAYPRGVAGLMFNNGPAVPDPPLDPNATGVVLFISEGDYVFQTFVDPTDAVLIDDLLTAVQAVPIAGPTKTGDSIRRTMSAMVILADGLEARGIDSASCLALTRFELEVRSQVSKRRIARTDGVDLIDRSSLIRSELGCGVVR